MKEKIGLVLEGGGFRGLYSEGVLENFLENNLHLPYVIGVSMGTAIGSSYIAKQKRRNYDIAMTYVDDNRYLSYRNLLTQGSIFGMDFLFQDLAYELIPFDFNTFRGSEQELVIGAMRCDTGATDYFYKSGMTDADLMTSMRASCSLPFISKMVEINRVKYLDGGISDSIPYKQALLDGCDKVVVILTRDVDYKRKAYNNHRLGAMFYRDFPSVVSTMEKRHIKYHETLDELMLLEKQGKALIIRPTKPIELSRMEKDRAKLRATYMLGYNQGNEMMEEIMTFVHGEKKAPEEVHLTYYQIPLNQLVTIESLWKKLNEIHANLSPDFGEHYNQMTFEHRTLKFHAIKEEDIRITIVKDQDEAIGYCITTTDMENTLGALESIYLKPAYRQRGIGEALVEDSKGWVRTKGCQKMVLSVSVGNESVLDFYKKVGFYPKLLQLELK